jgi:Ca-activated chloride channel family protein
MKSLLVTGLLLAGAVEPGPEPQAPQPPVFAVQVDSVLIDAFVTRDGKSVPGLTAKDFILKESGVAQPFDLLPVESLTIRAILVFDTSNSMAGEKLNRLRIAASSFLDRLRPGDEAALISFSDEVNLLTPLTDDLGRVKQGLQALQAFGATSVFDALFAALVAPRSASRTLVIVFCDGQDNMSWLREKQIRTAVERSNALIHVVAARPEEVESGYGRKVRVEPAHVKTLESLAEITGGSLIEVTSTERISAAFGQIVEQMKTRYVLRYTPENDLAPGWHPFDLQLRSGKGKVRGRTGYWVEGR